MSTRIVQVAKSMEIRRFLDAPWQLHLNDPNWVPPLRRNQRALAGFAKHPFYDTATSQAFIAVDERNHTVGRVLAIDNPVHHQIHGENLGFFGFFESVDDPSVAGKLLDAASDWLRNRGRDCLRGPMSPSVNYECGLLIDGFDCPPTFLMQYNPPYYPGLMDAAGFEKAQDLYTYTGSVKQMKSDNSARLAFIADKVLKRTGATVRSVNLSRMDRELTTFQHVYNQSFTQMWGFLPLSDREINHFAADLRHLLVPTFTSIAEVAGRPVGIQLGMLDFNPTIKAINGRLFPFGVFRFLFGKHKLKRLRLVSTFVLPEFQNHKGIGPALITRMIPSFESWGIEELEFSWVAESNAQSRAALVKSNTTITKTHRIYDKQL